MKIVKECLETTFHKVGGGSRTTTTCFLKTDSSMSLATLTALFNEAKKDFPGLTENDITVSRAVPLKGIDRNLAGGEGPVSFDSIQFAAPSTPPDTYKRLKPTGYARG